MHFPDTNDIFLFSRYQMLMRAASYRVWMEESAGTEPQQDRICAAAYLGPPESNAKIVKTFIDIILVI